MLYLKYVGVSVLLVLFHLFSGSTGLIAGWCLLGAVSCLWIREARRPLLALVSIEALIGLSCWILFWRNNDALRQLSIHSGTSPILWPLLAVAVNMITAFLCSATFFYLTRIIVKRQLL